MITLRQIDFSEATLILREIAQKFQNEADMNRRDIGKKFEELADVLEGKE